MPWRDAETIVVGCARRALGQDQAGEWGFWKGRLWPEIRRLIVLTVPPDWA
jgi:hypothetical protein